MKKKGILSVCLNSALDVTYVVNGISIGKVHKAFQKILSAGGKGNNVATALTKLDYDGIVIGFSGGTDGNLMEKQLSMQNVQFDFVKTENGVRRCTILVDTINSTQTVINEQGKTYSEDEIKKFESLFNEYIRKVDIVSLSGSIPPGIPQDYYVHLVETARQHDVLCIVDTYGEPLQKCIMSRPFVIKPNRTELYETFGIKVEREKDILQQYSRLCSLEAENVLITDGKNDVYLINKNAIIKFIPPSIKEVNAIASGDCLTAGLMGKYMETNDIVEAVCYGIATGSANAEKLIPVDIAKGRVEQLNTDLMVETIFQK